MALERLGLKGLLPRSNYIELEEGRKRKLEFLIYVCTYIFINLVLSCDTFKSTIHFKLVQAYAFGGMGRGLRVVEAVRGE